MIIEVVSGMLQYIEAVLRMLRRANRPHHQFQASIVVQVLAIAAAIAGTWCHHLIMFMQQCPRGGL